MVSAAVCLFCFLKNHCITLVRMPQGAGASQHCPVKLKRMTVVKWLSYYFILYDSFVNCDPSANTSP